MKTSKTFSFLYASLDVFATFLIVTLAFLSVYSFEEFGERIVSIMIYAAGTSVVTVLLFFLFKIYRIITDETSIYEFIRVCLVTIGVPAAYTIMETICSPNSWKSYMDKNAKVTIKNVAKTSRLAYKNENVLFVFIINNFCC